MDTDTRTASPTAASRDPSRSLMSLVDVDKIVGRTRSMNMSMNMGMKSTSASSRRPSITRTSRDSGDSRDTSAASPVGWREPYKKE